MIKDFSAVNKAWNYIIGSFHIYSPEHRAFNIISALCVAIMVFATTMNLWVLKLTANGIWTIFIGITVFVLYYLSRFQNKFQLASFIFCLLTYVMVGVNYFVNSGLLGPTVYGFLMTFFIIVIISPPQYYKYWIILHLLVVPLLYLMELKFPNLIINDYTTKFIQMSDHYLMYLTVIVVVTISAVFVKNTYSKEKFLLETKERAISIKNKELELSNQEKARLFSIIGHDLRSPINSIQGYLEMLSTSSLSVQERSAIEQQLLNLTRNTSDLLNNLLHWSMERTKMVEMVPVEVQPALNEVISLMTELAKDKKIELDYRIAEPITVCADKDMLQLVVRNLLNNAIKFTNPSGQISVKAWRNGKKAVITISDNGIGIPVEKQKQIFSSNMGVSYGTVQEKGVGLGLLLCYDFTRAMEGNIAFKSEERVGTKFMITLKLA